MKKELILGICIALSHVYADSSVKNYASNIFGLLVPNSIYVGDNPKYQGMFGMVSGVHRLKTPGCPKQKEAYVLPRGQIDLVKFENNASAEGFDLSFQEIKPLDGNFNIHPFKIDKSGEHVVGIFLTDSSSIEIGLMICDV